jgi:hypothetical protein
MSFLLKPVDLWRAVPIAREWQISTEGLSGFVNYSYQQIGQSLTDLARGGTPHSKVNVGLRGVWDNGISAEANFYYVGAADYPLGTAFTSLERFFPAGVPVPQERVPSIQPP